MVDYVKHAFSFLHADTDVDAENGELPENPMFHILCQECSLKTIKNFKIQNPRVCFYYAV